jgi:hypothetical protein
MPQYQVSTQCRTAVAENQLCNNRKNTQIDEVGMSVVLFSIFGGVV